MSRIVIGVDIGTTSTKAVAFTVAGRVLAHHAIDYPLLRPEPAAAEQDPEQIWQAVLAVISTCMRRCQAAPGEVICVSFSAAMHSLILVDNSGRALSPNFGHMK
jgi:gluconokinase